MTVRTSPVLLLCLVLAGCGYAGPRQLTFFPAAAAYDAQQKQWEAPIQGWVYQPRRWGPVRKLAWLWLRGNVDEQHRADAGKIFQERSSLFVMDGRGNSLVVVTIGDHQYLSPPTDNGGRFSFTVKLPEDQVQTLMREGAVHYDGYIFDGPLDKAKDLVNIASAQLNDVIAPGTTANDKSSLPTPLQQKHDHAAGYVRLVRPAGVAVITDIDDTIKISDVLDRRAMMRRMFMEPFVPVSGMPAAYRRWASQDAEVFYVSASPWQLYTTLNTFCDECEFPSGVFALKRVGIFDAYMSNIWTSTIQLKTDAIRQIFDRFPNRQFILVGDSTEHDFEIYADIARRYPDRVRHIFIRDIRNEGDQTPRFVAAFHDLPRQRWSLFSTGDDLPWKLDEIH